MNQKNGSHDQSQRSGSILLHFILDVYKTSVIKKKKKQEKKIREMQHSPEETKLISLGILLSEQFSSTS